MMNHRSKRLLRRFPELTPTVLGQIREALSQYPEWDGCLRLDQVKPCPESHPDQKYGPYSLIVKARYCANYGCVFGVTTNGNVHLWMD